MGCLVMVLQIKSPQETYRFTCHNVGHKQFLFTYRDCYIASWDGKSPYWLHDLNLDVPPLGTDLDYHIASHKNVFNALVQNYLDEFDIIVLKMLI